MSDHANLGQISQRAVENVQVGGNLTIGNITQFVGHRQPSFRKPTGIPQNIPHSGAAQFVGRARELETLHQQLQRTERVAISAISGMGGVGKTEMAIQYAIQYKSSYPGGVCWLKARASNLSAQLIDFVQLHLGLAVPQELWGKILTLEQQVEWCWQHWRPPGLVLVVLDDVADLASCREVLPPADRFRVLVTTRQRRLDPSFFELSLDVLSPEASLELLTALVGQSRIERELQAAGKLCEWLGYLPLGLELVGRYLAEDLELSFTQMLERLEVQRLQDEAIANEQQRQNSYFLMTAQHSVRAAFELSWQELDIPTSDVARLLGLFAPDVIPWELVESTIQQLNWSEQSINNTRKQLYKRNLIQQSGESCYKVHPLIREFLQAKLAESELADDLKRVFAMSMAAMEQVPKSPTIEQIQKIAPVIPHMKRAAEALTGYLSDENLCKPFMSLAIFYEGQGLYNLAETWRQQCLSVIQTRLGREHPDVAESLNSLGVLYLLQGRYSEAEPLFLRALEFRKQLLDNEHPSVAESLNDLALLYSFQGRYSEAEPLFLQSLEIRKHLVGEAHHDVTEILHRVALLYTYQARYSEAEPLFVKVLELRISLLGDKHPDVAETLNGLGLLYFNQRRFKKARTLFQQALELYQNSQGEEHPNAATLLQNLALIHLCQGHTKKAEQLFLKALELLQRLLGDNHPTTVLVLANLAEVYKLQRRYKKAEQLYLEVIGIYIDLVGENHPLTAKLIHNLAMVYFFQGRYQKAESTLVKSIGIAKRVLGKSHPDVKLYCRSQFSIAVWAILSIIPFSLIGWIIIILILKIMQPQKSILDILPEIFLLAWIGLLLGLEMWIIKVRARPLYALEWLFKKLESFCKNLIRFFYNYAICRRH
jgi:tetratricopeptide (TPR) repeat protein